MQSVRISAEASGYRRLLGDAARVFTGQTAGAAAAAVAGIVVVRTLGPVGRGELAYAAVVVTLATTAFSGVTTAAMLAVARRAAERPAAERRVLRSALRAGVGLALLLSAVALVTRSQWALLGAAAAVVPALVAAAVAGLLQYRGEVRRAVAMQQVTSTGAALATAAVVLLGGGIVGAFTCWVLALALAAALGRGRLRGAAPAAVESRGSAAQVGVMTTTLLAVVAYLNFTVDVYFVAGSRSAVDLGIYTLAIAAGELLWEISRSLVWPALAPLATLAREDAARLAARLTRHALALVGAAAVVVWFVAPFGIRLVYGERFAPAADLLRLVLPGVVAMAGESVLGSFVLLSMGCGRSLLLLQTVMTVACAVICYLGLPRYGLAAAAVGTSATYVLSFAGALVLAVRGGFPLRRLLRG